MTTKEAKQETLRPWAALGTDRLKSFSDGVFSIVITLLVLELHVPALSEKQSGSELMWALVEIWPNVVAYVASFVVIGIYWIAHHNLFHYAHRVNRGLLWLNHFYLMSVSLIAFTAAMLGRYPLNKVSVFFYGVNLLAVGGALSAMWRYVIKHNMVNEHAVVVFRATRVIVGIPLAFYSLAVLCAFFNPRISLWLYVAVPVVYVVPGILEHVLEWSARRHEAKG